MNIHVEKVQADLIAHTHENMEDMRYLQPTRKKTPLWMTGLQKIMLVGLPSSRTKSVHVNEHESTDPSCSVSFQVL